MSPAPTPKTFATVVPRPRAEDALGKALRTAYRRDAQLPDDMEMLIAQLNELGGRRCQH